MSLKNIVIIIAVGLMILGGGMMAVNGEEEVFILLISIGSIMLLYLSGILSMLLKRIEKTKLSLDTDIAALKQKKNEKNLSESESESTNYRNKDFKF